MHTLILQTLVLEIKNIQARNVIVQQRCLNQQSAYSSVSITCNFIIKTSLISGYLCINMSFYWNMQHISSRLGLNIHVCFQNVGRSFVDYSFCVYIGGTRQHYDVLQHNKETVFLKHFSKKKHAQKTPM